MTSPNSFLIKACALLCATVHTLGYGMHPASAQVVINDRPSSSGGVPAYTWTERGRRPKAIVIAVHGLSMHSGTYAVMADRLASEGMNVVAQDLRGFGRWGDQTPNGQSVSSSPKIDYEVSYKDLTNLIKENKSRFPDVPLFCIGESLGADLVVRAAGELPQDINGIVLSAPAIKRQALYGTMVRMSETFIAKPFKPIDITPLIKEFASDDLNVASEALADPLVRKRLSLSDLRRTCLVMKPTLEFAKRIPKEVSVLIIQGSNDRMVRPQAVMDLLACLKSDDQSIRWFHNGRHLLLETKRIQPETMDTISCWLNQRLENFAGSVKMSKQSKQDSTVDSALAEAI